jgi:hypothetical protein
LLLTAGIDPHDGWDVGQNAGISIAISFGLLAILTGMVNLLRWKIVSPRATSGAA